jgi:hypothetical protein
MSARIESLLAAVEKETESAFWETTSRVRSQQYLALAFEGAPDDFSSSS